MCIYIHTSPKRNRTASYAPGEEHAPAWYHRVQLASNDNTKYYYYYYYIYIYIMYIHNIYIYIHLSLYIYIYTYIYSVCFMKVRLAGISRSQPPSSGCPPCGSCARRTPLRSAPLHSTYIYIYIYIYTHIYTYIYMYRYRYRLHIQTYIYICHVPYRYAQVLRSTPLPPRARVAAQPAPTPPRPPGPPGGRAR